MIDIIVSSSFFEFKTFRDRTNKVILSQNTYSLDQNCAIIPVPSCGQIISRHPSLEVHAKCLSISNEKGDSDYPFLSSELQWKLLLKMVLIYQVCKTSSQEM